MSVKIVCWHSLRLIFIGRYFVFFTALTRDPELPDHRVVVTSLFISCLKNGSLHSQATLPEH